MDMRIFATSSFELKQRYYVLYETPFLLAERRWRSSQCGRAHRCTLHPLSCSKMLESRCKQRFTVSFLVTTMSAERRGAGQVGASQNTVRVNLGVRSDALQRLQMICGFLS